MAINPSPCFIKRQRDGSISLRYAVFREYKESDNMHLYTFSPAPNPQRLAYYLKYKSINIDTTEVSISKGEQFSEEFKAINPASTLPALVLDDGSVLTDTIAICVYLESLHPEKSLFGSNATEYAKVIGWSHKIYVDGLMAAAEIFRNSSSFFKDRAMPGKLNIPQLESLVERGRLRLTAFWEELDQQFTERDYLVGEQLTLADIDAYVICKFSEMIKAPVSEKYSHLARWRNNVAEQLAD